MLKSSNDSEFSFEAQRQALRGISTDELRSFGVNHIAYIKPSSVLGNRVFTICGADGTPLVALDTLDSALTVARQNDLEPVILQ
jgi:hypothetical protein